MVSEHSRRALLRATGIAVASGLAGCGVQYDPVTQTTQPTATADDNRTTPSYGDVGPNGTDSGETDGTRTTATATVTTGRTFTFVVENGITTEALKKAPDVDVDADTPATITLVVEENWPDGQERNVFEKTFDLPPGETRRFRNAFTTKLNGPTYIVRAKLAPFPGQHETSSRNRSSAHRFTPGGYGAPTGTTIGVDVSEFGHSDRLIPSIGLDVPGE